MASRIKIELLLNWLKLRYYMPELSTAETALQAIDSWESELRDYSDDILAAVKRHIDIEHEKKPASNMLAFVLRKCKERTPSKCGVNESNGRRSTKLSDMQIAFNRLGKADVENYIKTLFKSEFPDFDENNVGAKFWLSLTKDKQRTQFCKRVLEQVLEMAGAN